MDTQAVTSKHQITYLENRRQELVDHITGRQTWIEDNSGLIYQDTTVVEEVDRRIHARTLLYQSDPPAEVLTVLGQRAAMVKQETSQHATPRTSVGWLPRSEPESRASSSWHGWNAG